MVFFRLHLQGLIRLALVAVLATAVWPTISRAALADAAGTPAWAEICTARGLQLVALGTDRSGASDAGAAPYGHGLLLDACDLCLLAAMPALGMAPETAGRSEPAADPAPRPDRTAAVAAATSWDAARPRGPPAA